MKTKILTIADGFGDSISSPAWYPEYHKWPFILNLMTKNLDIIDFSRYGAGNEYMVSVLKDQYRSVDKVLIQWSIPDRLDLVLAHQDPTNNQWQELISSDPVYSENIRLIGQDKWWLSSASTQSWVRDYHERFISKRQHQIRSQIWIEYAHQLLSQIPHRFMLAYDSLYLDGINVDPNVWIWHDAWKGMHDYRYHSEYRSLDLGIVQPIPLIHFDFIKRFVMPNFDLPWRNDRELAAVESMLLRKYNLYKDQKPE